MAIKEAVDSRMSIAGHPIHPTLVHFPVAALLALVPADLAYLYTNDFFWGRLGLWLAGIGALGGWLAGLVGLIDLVTVAAIRRLITAWNHAMLAVVMLSLASFNWLLRIDDATALIGPWGIYMSVLTTLVIILTGIQGGQLVYEHGVGVNIEP